MPDTDSSCSRLPDLQAAIARNVSDALAEDLGSGDLTAELIAAATAATATVITREAMTLAGRPWVEEVFRQLDSGVRIEWYAADGETLAAGETVCELSGQARSLLSGERTALNFMQTLSATATVTARYVDAIKGTGARILDTRKTLPGLRIAQKYAVRCGGGDNHRVGLFDAILIKENHIESAGGIGPAIAHSRALYPDRPVEIEVENLSGLREALEARAERLLLDNFTVGEMRLAVQVNRDEGKPPAELEASGGMALDTVRCIAETGVDFISVGALTKNIDAVDLSMRFRSG
ncbi:MAG TPA: carboxylating nicotinate-nucleotide diphosphorylase [Woeseiaceae bacterium]